jgi:glycerophosphoryl diester phosphodiesterase
VKIYGHGSLEPGNLINSRASFVRLAGLGIDGIELDVRRSRDDRLVVIHDAAYSDGRAVDATASVARPSEVLLLGEALDLCAGLEVNVELKNHPRDEGFDPSERIADLLVRLLADRGGRDRVIVSSFGIACIDLVRTLRPEIPTAHLVLSRRSAAEVIRPAIEHGHRLLHPYESMVDEVFVAACRAADLAVNVWTGDDESDQTIAALCRLGVDGVITADPGRARRVRDRPA